GTDRARWQPSGRSCVSTEPPCPAPLWTVQPGAVPSNLSAGDRVQNSPQRLYRCRKGQLVEVNSYSYVTYTGTTGTSFTGGPRASGPWSGAASNAVWTPVVWFEPGGYAGQAPKSFQDGTIMVLGNQVVVNTDKGGPNRSNRATIRRIGGAG